ncbi:MAG: hypothetical protein MJ001_03075 [Paludibacteraceae bacterium]|nr:hypothetical protein [Paludibacteraceae bacterium]
MINIVIYGKPRAFESHDFCFEGKDGSTFTDNSFHEPILKPKHFGEYVIHYFSKNGYAGVECYNKAKGYECERDGIVFGIALKTDHDFSITKVKENILKPYWSDFASALLNDDRFIRPTILEILNGTKWDKNDSDNIKGSIEASPFHVPTKKMCLLYAPELDQISKVESQLKEYEDVYISANLDIFKDSINSVVLNLTQGRICTIENGTIVEIIEDNIKDTDTRNRINWFGWRTRQTSGNNDGDGNGENTGKNKTVVFLGAIVVIVALLFATLKLWQAPDEGNQSGGGNEPSSTPQSYCRVSFKEYDGLIKEKLDLSPEIVKNSGTVVMNDIEFRVDNSDNVDIEEADGHRILKVKIPPKNNLMVTVQAYYKETVVGSQQYLIAAAEGKTGTGTNVEIVPGSKPTNPSIEGKRIDIFLHDLETYTLKDPTRKNYVKTKCDYIINSGLYSQQYMNKAEEIKQAAENLAGTDF